jgi:predicted nuclease of predicted toxin-antitoxin system
VVEAVRFYMDQHFPGPASRALARHGIDVLTAQEADRCGLPDAEQLAFAAAEDRVMVTFDSDFPALHQSDVKHAGIAWCPARKYAIRELIQVLLLLHGVMDRDAMRNHLEYL